MYTLWNKEDIQLPERSICYPLEPISLNNIGAESLTSYFQRLSEAHSVSVGIFVKDMILSVLFKEGHDEYIYRGVFIKSYSINGHKKLSLNILSILEKITTRSDLKYLTFHSIDSFFGSKELKTIRSWCPVCFELQKKKNSIVYEKLIWSLKSVTTCIEHNCYLESKCPQCKNEHRHLETQSVMGHCPKCNCWLGATSDLQIKIDTKTKEWQKWVYNNLNEIFKENLKGKIDRKLILNRVSEFLQENFNSRKKQTLLAEYMYFHWNSILMWKNRSRDISLEALLILSYCVNQSIYSILYKNQETNLDDLRRFEDVRINTRKNAANRNRSNKEQLLNEYIESNEYPPLKLGDVAKRLGYNHPQPLIKYFPNECKVISKRYKEYRSEVKKQRISLTIEKIDNCINEALQEGITPSSKLIRKRVPANLLFGKIIWDYLKEIDRRFS